MRLLGNRSPRIPGKSCSGILLFVVLPALMVTLWSKPASAYAWLIKHGYAGCPTCHMDPSGGELLTQYGRVQGDLILRMQYGDSKDSAAASKVETEDGGGFDSFGDFDDFDSGGDEGAAEEGAEDEAEESSDDSGDASEDEDDKGKNAGDEGGTEQREPGFLWGLLPPSGGFTLGGSFRNLTVYDVGGTGPKIIPIMMGDLYFHIRAGDFRAGASVGIAKVPVGSAHARAAQVTRAQGDQLNMISRSHWLGFDMGDGAYTLRFGRMNLPFGVRIPEHTMWVREATRTDRESDQQHGVALAYNGDDLRGEAMVIAGNYQINPDHYRERGYSAFGEYFLSDTMAVGLSSLVTYVKDDRILLQKEVLRQAHGAMARITATENIVLLAEADATMVTGGSLGFVGFAQLDYELVQGLHFALTGEGRNPGGAGAVTGYGGWASVMWYFYNQFELRVDVQQHKDASTRILGQLHVFL